MADFVIQNGNLLFKNNGGGDNAKDIGRDDLGALFRPRDGYFGTSLRVGSPPTGVHSVFTGAGLQVTVGGATLVGANVTTDATRKTTRLATAHYTNATAPFLWVRAVSDNGANTLQLGGGDGALTPASAVAIFTSATPGTPGIGTQRWHWNSAGNLLASTDNANDLGASGATRPRTGYFGTSVVIGADPGGTDALRVGGKLRSSDVWIMTGSPSSPGAGTRYLGGSGPSNLKFNVASGGAHIFSVNDVEKARIDDDFTVPAGVKWKSSTGHNVMYASGSEDIEILRHFGSKPNTLLRLWAPTGALTPREATLALVRGDEGGPQEFLDLYNNGYPSATPPSVKFGIRIFKVPTNPPANDNAQWRDFHFERQDGSTPGAEEEPIFILRVGSDRSAEAYGPWLRFYGRHVEPPSSERQYLEFFDAQNDPSLTHYGIRLQKRTVTINSVPYVGAYRDFVFDRSPDGTSTESIFKLRASTDSSVDRSAEFWGPNLLLPRVASDPSFPIGQEVGRLWCRTDLSPPQIRYWTGSAVRVLSSTPA
jgi:hypothetical protein